MKTYFFYKSIYIFILMSLLINACQGQMDTSSSKEKPKITKTLKPAPEVVGIPGISHSGPVYDPDLVAQYIRCIFHDSKGNYWFGPAGQSVVRYDGDTLRYFYRSEFFEGNTSIDTFNSVHAIAEDQDGNIWFGTDHGAVKYDGQTFRSYTQKHGLSNVKINRHSIFVDPKGTLWVGTQGGVFQYNPLEDHADGQCFSRFHLLPPLNIKDIMEDNSGNLWFASQNNGVFRYDGKTVTNFTEKEGLGDNYVGGIVQDKEGDFWFTMKKGICRYDGNTFQSFTTKDGLGGSEVWGIYKEQSGIIWISARGSTTKFDPSASLTEPKAFTVYTSEDGINCCVQSMHQDRLGNMWWGAGEGLYRFDGERFYQVKRNGPW